MSIIYRDYDEARDFAGQRDLFRLCFPEVLGTSVECDAHYHWKFGGYPEATPFRAYVAEEGGVLIGFYAAIPYRYSVDGRVLTAGMVCDVMTHPEWRGRGIFTGIGRYALQRLAESGVAFTTGYPIRPEVLPGHMKVGWRVVQKMPMYLRPIGTRSILPGWLRWVSPLADPVVRLCQKLISGSGHGYRSSVMEREAFLEWAEKDAFYPRFHAAWAVEQQNGLIKDVPFLSWRTAAPDTTYQFVCLHEEDELVGLALVRPTVLKGVSTLAVLDFMVLSAHLAGAKVLHRALLDVGISKKTDLVACMMSRPLASRNRLAGSLYLRSPFVFELIVNRIGTACSDDQVYDPLRWNLGWIDSDDL